MSFNFKRKRAKARKRTCHQAAADIQQVQYDTELTCLRCKTPLLVSEKDAYSLIMTVRSGGTAIIVCAVCGLYQPVRRKV